MSLLPEDEDLSTLQTMALQSEDTEEETPAMEDVNPYDAHLAETFAPIPARLQEEQETVKQSVQSGQPPDCHGRHPWSTNCVHPLCSRSAVARTSSTPALTTLIAVLAV